MQWREKYFFIKQQQRAWNAENRFAGEEGKWPPSGIPNVKTQGYHGRTHYSARVSKQNCLGTWWEDFCEGILKKGGNTNRSVRPFL